MWWVGREMFPSQKVGDGEARTGGLTSGMREPIGVQATSGVWYLYCAHCEVRNRRTERVMKC